MGKRTREQPSYEHLAKKFKKLEKMLVHAQRNNKRVKPPPIPPEALSSSSSAASSRDSSRCGSRAASPAPPASSSSSSSSCSSDCSSRSGSPAPAPISQQEPVELEERPSEPRFSIRDAPSTSALPPHTAAVSEPPLVAAAHTLEAAQPEPPTLEKPQPAELDEELLKILGEDPSKTKASGKDIQPDLAVRLQHIATAGLSKEARKELLDKYLPPGNCTLIDAPDLNPEVKAAVSETIYKRDKGIKTKQKQVASAIACVAEAITVLLSAEEKDKNLIQILMDASKLLCDSQNQDSTTRRNFVLFNLKKELKDQLQATKIDKYLFSKDLADTLKAAKAISKSGADMKPAATAQPPKKPNKQPQKNLNWRAPASTHSQKPRGTPRKEPARKNRPDYYSRTLSRPAPPPPPPPPPAPSRSRR